MSEILQRTFKALANSVSDNVLDSGGSLWARPTQGEQHTLAASLATQLSQVASASRKQEKDVWREHVAATAAILSKPGVSPHRVSECLIRGMFIQLTCGGDTSVTQPLHIHAVKLAQDTNVLNRKLGYLASTILLPTDSELRILLTNCLVKDLDRQDVPSILTGLIAVVNILTESSVISLLLPRIVQLTCHQNHLVRSKALITLDRFCVLKPALWPEVVTAVASKLSDPDPGVVSQSLKILTRHYRVSPIGEDDLSSDDRDFCQPVEGNVILKAVLRLQEQINANKLPKDFLYQKHFQAPWLQIDLLRMIRNLSSVIEQEACEEDRELVRMTLEKLIGETFPKENIALVIVYEAVITASQLMNSNPNLLRKSLKQAGKFLQSRHLYHKHAGLCLLETIIQSKTKLKELSDIQVDNVLQCLDYPDKAIQRKTLSLVTSLVTKSNVRRYTDSIMPFMKTCEAVDQYIVRKLFDLVRTLSDDLTWQVTTTMRLVQVSTGRTRSEMIENLKFFLSPTPFKTFIVPETTEGDSNAASIAISSPNDGQVQISPELAKVRKKFLKVLTTLTEEKKANETTFQLLVWAITEFYHHDPDVENPNEKADAICERIVSIGQQAQPHETELVIQCLLAFETMKIKTRYLPQSATDFITACSKSPQMDVRETARCVVKFSSLVDSDPNCLGAVSSLDFTLSFLDGLVYSDLCKGGQPYFPQTQRHQGQFFTEGTNSGSAAADSKPLNLTPYNRLRQDTTESLGKSFCSSNSPEPLSLSTSVRRVWTAEGRIDDAEEDDQGSRIDLGQTFRDSSSGSGSGNADSEGPDTCQEFTSVPLSREASEARTVHSSDDIEVGVEAEDQVILDDQGEEHDLDEMEMALTGQW